MRRLDLEAVQMRPTGVDRVAVVQVDAEVHIDLLVGPIDIVGVGVDGQGAVQPGGAQGSLIVPGVFGIIGEQLGSGRIAAGSAGTIAALDDETCGHVRRQVVEYAQLGQKGLEFSRGGGRGRSRLGHHGGHPGIDSGHSQIQGRTRRAEGRRIGIDAGEPGRLRDLGGVFLMIPAEAAHDRQAVGQVPLAVAEQGVGRDLGGKIARIVHGNDGQDGGVLGGDSGCGGGREAAGAQEARNGVDRRRHVGAAGRNAPLIAIIIEGADQAVQTVALIVEAQLLGQGLEVVAVLAVADGLGRPVAVVLNTLGHIAPGGHGRDRQPVGQPLG